MISDFSVIIFLAAMVALIIFFIWSKTAQKRRQLLHNLFLLLAVAYTSWIIPLIIMRFVPEDNEMLLYILDCAMQPGGALCSPIYLCIAVTFVSGNDKLSKWLKAIFILPVATILIAWTNPLHHLYYQQFAVVRSQIVFGP